MIGHEKYSYRRVAAKASASLLTILALFTAAVIHVAAQTAPATPTYVVSSQSLLTNNIGGNTGNFAANSRGDVFLLDANSPQHLLEYPANGGAPITLFTDSATGGPNGVAVDPFDNVFLTADTGFGSGNVPDTGIYRFPSNNQAYPGAYTYDSSVPPGACNLATPAQPPTNTNPAGTPAVPANLGVCSVGNWLSADGYYMQPREVAADGQGNVYEVSNYDNAYKSVAKGIFECDPKCVQQAAGGAAFELTPLPGSPGAVANPISSFAADYAGDIFFTANYSQDTNNPIPGSNQIYELPVAGRTSPEVPIVFDASYTNPYGVQFDPSGNLYVTDANGIWEVPSVETTGGAPCQGGTDMCTLVPAAKFEVIPLLNGLPTFGNSATGGECYYQIEGMLSGPAVDNRGNIVYAYGCLYYGRINVYKASLWSGTFPATELGSTASSALTFNVVFNTATTIKSIAAVQGSAAATEFTLKPGTCTAGSAFAIGGNCSFTVSFTPGGLGLRSGAVQITDTTGKTTITTLSGVGNGTAVTVDPGTPNLVSSTFKQSTGLAVDSAGNTYVTDSLANTVTEFPAGGGTPVSIGTGLSVPTGVAVDGSGDVFIVNQGTGDKTVMTGTPPVSTVVGTGSVVEVPNVAGVLATSAQTTVLNALHTPTDIVIDNFGDLYVSATGSNEVLQFPSPALLVNGTAPAVRGYGLSGPTGLALDNSGNVYVADTGNDRVLELGDGTQIQVGNGLTAPTGVAVDTSGSVLIADGSGRIIRVPNESGNGGIGLNQVDQQVLDSPLSYPYALRLDSTGNLYVTDNVANQVYQLVRTTGTLDFGNWNVNTVSDPQTIILSNSGTDLITLGNPVFAPVPASTEFTVAAGTSSQACGGGTFNSGYSCELTATFSPTASGESTYSLALAAPNTEDPTPAISLKGNGVMLGQATITIAQTAPTGAIAYGDTIKFSANVTPTSSSAPTPTGSVVFSFDGQDFRSDMVTGGVANFTFPPLTNAGTHSLSAHYLGDTNYPELQSAVTKIVIAQSTTTNTLAIVGDSADPLSAAPSSTVNMTDTICSATNGLLQGTVTFYNTATSPATALDVVTLGAPDTMLTCANGLSPYIATFSFNASNGMRPGVYNIDAVYSGNSNYAGDTSASYLLTVTPPTYTVTFDKTAVTSSASSPGVVNLVVTDYSNFQAGVSFTCAPAPATGSTTTTTTSTSNYITNQFAPSAYCVQRPVAANLAPAGGIIPNTIYPVSLALQFQVDQNPLVVEGSFGWAGAAFALLLLLVWRRRIPARGLRLLSLLFVVVCLGGIASLSGCGSGSGSSYKTPPGTYNVVVTATATPETNGVGSKCNLQNCSEPAGPDNPTIDIVQTYNVTVTVK